MNRREVIQRLAALAALPVIGRREEGGGRRDTKEVSSLLPPPSSLVPIGLALYTVRDLAARDFEGTLRAVAAIGYRDLDMYPDVGKLPPKETRALLDRYGLSCRSARFTTATLRGDFDGMLETARVLGARWVTLANVPAEDRKSTGDWDTLFGQLNRAGESARKAGLALCYHNHDFELQPLEGRVPFDALLSATDAQLVRLQMDVYWMTKGGRSAPAEIRRMGSRVATLHLKDMDATPERGITTVGRGTIDFTAVLRAAQEAKVADAFVEEDNPGDPMAAARQSYQHLAKLAT